MAKTWEIIYVQHENDKGVSTGTSAYVSCCGIPLGLVRGLTIKTTADEPTPLLSLDVSLFWNYEIKTMTEKEFEEMVNKKQG